MWLMIFLNGGGYEFAAVGDELEVFGQDGLEGERHGLALVGERRVRGLSRMISKGCGLLRRRGALRMPS
jgi:hypothetical protein